MSMAEIEKQTENFAAARRELIALIETINTERHAVTQRHAQNLRELTEVLINERDLLYVHIESNLELFEKPKTRVLHDIKIGYRKMLDEMQIDDVDSVIKRIVKTLPEQVQQLINTKMKLNKPALQKLPENILKNLGVSVNEVGDAMIIKPVGGEFDRIIDALLTETDDDPEVLL